MRMRPRRTSLAIHNLLHQPARTIVSILGIAFAVLLMFMQLGFLGSVGDTATLVYEHTPGQIVVRSREYLSVYNPRSLDAEVLNRLITLPSVTAVRPLDLTVASWQHPTSGAYLAVAMMGVDVDSPALDLDELAEQRSLLRRPEFILMDRASRNDFGPANGIQFGAEDVGRSTAINFRRVQIAGTFQLGTGLAANGAALTSRAGFARLARNDSSRVSMVFVDLASGISVDEGRRAIQEKLSQGGGTLAHADVLSLQQAQEIERRHWYLEKPVGVIFWIGVALAVVVGGVICYMVLSADVVAHLPEYATLKAIGYSNAYLGRTLLTQATLLAMAALPLATLAALGLYRVTSALSGLPIRMTWQWILLVSVLTLVMCGVAGMLTLRKLSKAEPASLF